MKIRKFTSSISEESLAQIHRKLFYEQGGRRFQIKRREKEQWQELELEGKGGEEVIVSVEAVCKLGFGM
jgi:hypothetical protein